MSLALDAAGNPVISYLNQGNTNVGTLHVFHCGDPDCASGNVDTPVDATASNQTTSSLILDATGNPVVSYGYNNTNVAVLHCGNANCTSGNTIATPDTGGYWSSLALDAMGRPVVSYTNLARQLKVLHCATSVANDQNDADGCLKSGQFDTIQRRGLLRIASPLMFSLGCPHID